ncbi:MAG: hypothetical protein P8P88_01580 [Polaribacter sp.]|nr:hypothetical protein [Polaribacter sp.]
MKSYIVIFLMVSTTFFSQKKISKQFETDTNEINIYTAGLDNITIENSESGFVEVFLYAEDYDEQLIKINHKNTSVNINFEFKGAQTREVVFRKFITKRLQRAHVIVKVPKNKEVYVFGENVDIESKDFKNNLVIYIENGIVKLNTIKANTILKLYSGNVFANTKTARVNVKTVHGKIEVNGILKEKTYQKTSKIFDVEVTITSVKANVFLTSK